MEIQIRPYREEDLPQVQALESQVKPYRPEDQTEVEAMFERAQQAKETRDKRWMPLPPPLPRFESVEKASLAFWLAVAKDQVVGMVAVYRAEALEMPENSPRAIEWRCHSDVAELRRLRVSPELRQQGIGTRLNQTAIQWSREHGFQTLILNTTAAQIPALNLYRKLGFREVDRSFVEKYELVWFELAL